MMARSCLYFDPISLHQQKIVFRVGPPLTKLSGSMHDMYVFCNILIGLMLVTISFAFAFEYTIKITIFNI